MAPKVTKSIQIPTLAFDGKIVKENDHVFVSAPWYAREGEPYMIARVMEFLPSTSIPSSNSHANSEGSTTGPRARVAYYLRPRDISNRYISDFRLIVATMHADIIPLSYIRGVCTVKHRDEIKELDVYKREKDTFYFHSLYDRYLHRYFDAVLSHRIQNAPANVVSYLVNNFEYILCEPALSNELCDAQRGCSVCSKWAASTESVTCAMCKCVFHLYCLDPPLAQRPKTGYSWSCAPCSKAHEDEVEAYMETGISPVKKISDTVAVPGNSRAKGKGRASESKGSGDKGKGKEVVTRPAGDGCRTTNGWPMRYFGMHTDALAVLDPHDSLHPRASTRLGNKFQVIVPVWDNEKKEQDCVIEVVKKASSSTSKRSRNGTPTSAAEKIEKIQDEAEKKRKSKLPERGEDEAAQIIFQPTEKISDTQLDKLLKDTKALPVYKVAGVDLIDKVLSLVGTSSITEAIPTARSITQTQLGHAIWTTEESTKLIQGVAHHNNDLEEIADEIETKSLSDIVKRYYIVLGHDRQEDVPTQTVDERERVVVISRSGRRASGVNYAEDWFENDESSEDEGSIVGPAVSVSEKRGRICAVCSTKSSPEWYHCPESFGETAKAGKDHLMCNDCGVRWRHYGASYPPAIEEVKSSKVHRKVERIEGEIKKEEKKDDRKKEKKETQKEKPKEKQVVVPSRATPIPTKPAAVKPVLPSKPCVLCKRMDPKPQLSQCYNCGLSVHSACYGIPENPPLDWLCDLCNISVNKKRLPSNIDCILCPPPNKSSSNEQLTALDCVKPTEGNHYAHIICGIFHPELKFSDPSTLKVIESIPYIPQKRRDQTCHICEKKDVGACIKCEDCLRYFHVACAWTAGYKFAFEMKRLKKKRTREIVSAKFKEEDGSLTPCVWCPDHHFSQIDRATYDLGQRDPKTRLTVLQTYVRADKAYRLTDSFAILRQARALDVFVNPVLAPPPSALNVPNLEDIFENSNEFSVSPPPAPAQMPIPRPIKVSTSSQPVTTAAVHTRPNTLTGPRPANSSRKNPNPKGSKRAARVVTDAVSSASYTALTTPVPTLSLPAIPPVANVDMSRSQGFAQKNIDQTFPRHLAAPSRVNTIQSERSQVVPRSLPPIRSTPPQSIPSSHSDIQQAVQPPRLNSQYTAQTARTIPQFAAQSSRSKQQQLPQLSRANDQPLPKLSHHPKPITQSPFSSLSSILNPASTSYNARVSAKPRDNQFRQSSQDLYASHSKSQTSQPQNSTALPRYRSPPPVSLPPLAASTDRHRKPPVALSYPSTSRSVDYAISPLFSSNSRHPPVAYTSINGSNGQKTSHDEISYSKRKVVSTSLFDESLNDTSPKRIKLSSASFLPSSLPQLPSIAPVNSNSRLSSSDQSVPKLSSSTSASIRPTSSSGKPLPVDFALDPSLEFAGPQTKAQPVWDSLGKGNTYA